MLPNFSYPVKFDTLLTWKPKFAIVRNLSKILDSLFFMAAILLFSAKGLHNIFK